MVLCKLVSLILELISAKDLLQYLRGLYRRERESGDVRERERERKRMRE